MKVPSLEQMQEAVAIKEEIARLEIRLQRTLGITEDDADAAFLQRARRAGGKMIPLREALNTVKTAPAAKTPRVNYLSTLGLGL